MSKGSEKGKWKAEITKVFSSSSFLLNLKAFHSTVAACSDFLGALDEVQQEEGPRSISNTCIT